MSIVRTGLAKVVTLDEPRCRRCDRTFKGLLARNKHYEDSSRHNICDVCRFDGSSCDELVQHHRSTRHRIMCHGCGDGGWWIPDSKAYKDHLRDDNVCTICERHFDSPSNLRHVSITAFKTFCSYPPSVLALIVNSTSWYTGSLPSNAIVALGPSLLMPG